ncbi:substrate-binding domain-containing protein [Pelotomaculum isophthalicicum JI]|uniref:Substrate-binding domain-containing protein n=1 Tax=Pelotomaculum isophthalicicum JI TaxID=947010 RepID=A0A9X4H053_9FIRM|nr:substrate-binding domain-containing protein [Pelotomaculum isophthalicicum]MDF9406996.1 substrate-binding domain-containing protein [Pelotomaculum isophthalicicum JI]
MGDYKIKYKYFPLVIIMTMVLTFLCGCGGQGQAQKKPVSNNGNRQEVKIAVSLADLERDGNQIFKRTMSGRQGQGGQSGGQNDQGGQQGKQDQSQNQQAGEMVVPVQAGGGQGGQGSQGGQGQQVNITWLDAKNDSAKQEKDLDDLIKQKVRVVILQLVDPSAGPRLVRKLAQANIKVIALETLPANSPLDGYIASDHARTGELQSRYLLSAAQGRSAPLKAVVLQGDKNDQASREITSSLLENLKDQAQVQVVLVKDHPAGDPQMAKTTLEQALTSTNNQIDAILITDDRMGTGVAEVLKNRGLSKRIVTIGAGAGKQASQALAAGEHDAEVDVMPELMAQYAYDAAVGLATTGHWQYDKQIRNGDFDVPARITPVRLITRNESYLLEQRWGKPAAGQEGGQGGQPGQRQQSSQDKGQSSDQSDQKKVGGGQGDQGGGKKTTLRVTTQDGKTMEMQINGEIKKIETMDGAGGGKSDGGDQGQAGSGAGGQGGSGS